MKAIPEPEVLAKTLWRLHARFADRTSPTVVRQVLSAESTAALPRQWETNDDRFAVTLASGPVLSRTQDFEEASHLYLGEPRTRLFESVHTRAGEWQSDVAAVLASWLDADVLSSAYEARRGDRTLPEHADAWHNIVLQLLGTKRWRFGADEVLLEPGDVLIVPTGVVHFVETDDYSVHINFEVIDPEVVEEYMATSTVSP
jgi:hypothetical protein